MPEYKLIARGQRSYKVALMLALAHADWGRSGSTSSCRHPPPEYLELNEMGEVPILEHGELRLTVRRHPRLSRAALPRVRPRLEAGAARYCAGRSGTTTG